MSKKFSTYLKIYETLTYWNDYLINLQRTHINSVIERFKLLLNYNL